MRRTRLKPVSSARVWRISGRDGRIAWFRGDDRAALDELIRELFGGPEQVTVEEVPDPPGG